MNSGRTGVLVMAYGTPSSPDQLAAYYTHIRRGRPPEPQQLDDLRRRYDALGGTSTLAQRTTDQVAAVRSSLDAIEADRFVVALGQKHAFPFIEDGAAELLDESVDAVVGVVLAPHYSGFSVGQYHERAAAALGTTPFTGLRSWFDLPELVEHQSDSLRGALTSLTGTVKVLFTAHSLPERVLVGDPYPDELRNSATLIADAAGLPRWSSWSIAWQSAGRTPEPWRGPDILTVIDDLAATGRADAVVVVPHGFTSDHLEVAYDLDIEASDRAAAAGLRFARTNVVNDDPQVMGALARTVAGLAET